MTYSQILKILQKSSKEDALAGHVRIFRNFAKFSLWGLTSYPCIDGCKTWRGKVDERRQL